MLVHYTCYICKCQRLLRSTRGFHPSYAKKQTHPPLARWSVGVFVIQSHFRTPGTKYTRKQKRNRSFGKKKQHLQRPVNHAFVCSEAVSPALRCQPVDSTDDSTRGGFQTKCKLAPSPRELTSWIKDLGAKYWLLSMFKQFELHIRRGGHGLRQRC